MALLLFFIFVDPFVPVALNICRFFTLFGQSWPVWFLGIFFGKDQNHLEAGFAPLRFILFDWIKELDDELVFFAMRVALKIERVSFEIDFLIGDVSETQCDEDSLFSLGPSDSWMKGHVVKP